LINPEWVDAGSFHDYEVVNVHAEEPWAANTVRVGASLCVGAAFPRTAEMLSRRGYDVRPVDVSEFAKAEGGLTCMSLIFKEASGS
jgi:dimethylargininase